MHPFRINIFNEQYNNPKTFRDKQNHVNLEHGQHLAYYVIIAELLFMVIAINSYFNAFHSEFQYARYISLYGLMILVNMAFIAWARFAHEKTIPSRINLYCGFMLVWGTVITLLDQALYSNLNAFFVNLTIVSTLFYHDRRTMTLLYGLSVVPLFILLPFFQPSSDILIGHYVNGSVIICFMWIASRLIFKGFVTAQNHNDDLKQAASLDALTGLGNRYGLTDYILKIQSSEYGIIMLDIDDFKAYNDLYGHVEGDKVLIEVSQRIRLQTVDRDCHITRYGGEEFLVLLKNGSLEETYQLAENIRKSICESSKNLKSALSVSSGVVTATSCEVSGVWNAIEKADQLLYVSKSSGKNRTTFDSMSNPRSHT